MQPTIIGPPPPSILRPSPPGPPSFHTIGGVTDVVDYRTDQVRNSATIYAGKTGPAREQLVRAATEVGQRHRVAMSRKDKISSGETVSLTARHMHDGDVSGLLLTGRSVANGSSPGTALQRQLPLIVQRSSSAPSPASRRTYPEQEKVEVESFAPAAVHTLGDSSPTRGPKENHTFLTSFGIYRRARGQAKASPLTDAVCIVLATVCAWLGGQQLI